MELDELRRHWNGMGQEDPLFSILTVPGKAGGRWNTEEFFGTGRQQVEHVFQQLETLGVKVRHGSAMDFGCGVGRLTQALVDRFDVVHGVDIAPSMISLAGQYNKVGTRCQYHLNERDDLSLFPDATFDFVLTLICLQHMEPRYARKYLAEFARILAPGGVVFFQLPGARRWLTKTGLLVATATLVRRLGLAPVLRPLVRTWEKRRRVDSEYRMEMYVQPPHEVIALLEANGLKVLSTERDTLTGNEFVSYRYVAVRK